MYSNLRDDKKKERERESKQKNKKIGFIIFVYLKHTNIVMKPKDEVDDLFEEFDEKLKVQDEQQDEILQDES